MLTFAKQLIQGKNPLSGRRLHPFIRLSVYLNFLMMAIGCLKLLLSLLLSKEARMPVDVALDLLLSAAGILLSLRVRRRLLAQSERQEKARSRDVVKK